MRGFRHLRPLILLEVATKQMPCAGAAGAERTAREIRGADHRPSARRRPGYYQGGMVGASNCTNGPYYGPRAAKSAQTRLVRGFARGLPDDDRDRSHGFFNTTLSTPMVGLVGVGEGRWSWGRRGTRRTVRYTRLLGAGRGNGKHERPRVSARSDAAHRDARAPRPVPTHPTTRPGTYFDMPSRLERGARAR